MHTKRLILPLLLVAAVAVTACSSTGSTTTAGAPSTGAVATAPPGTAETEEAATDATVPDAGAGATITTTAGELAGEGTTLPIVMKTFANGYQKPTVMISVGGGSAVPVLIDTGSTGLHVLASAAGTTGVTTTTDAITETYSDGTQYQGVRATAPVTIGGVASAAPIALMLINTVGCTAANSACPTPNEAALVSTDGVYGTMGVSLEPSDAGCAAALYSPLLQLPGGATGFTVAFSSTAGTITLGNQPPGPGGQAVPLQASTYSTPTGTACATSGTSPTYPNGSGAWDPASAQLCWSVGGASAVCGATTFDTGTEDVGIAIASFPSAPTSGSMVASGTAIVLTAPGGTTPLWSFTAGSSAGVDRVQTSSPAASLLATTGSPFYFHGAVTYDADGGRLVITPSA